MQAGGTETGQPDLAGQFLGAVLGAGEDQHRIGVGLFEQCQQQGGLQVLRHGIERMRHGVRRAAETNGDPLRVCQGLSCQSFDLRRESGREEHGLPFGRDVFEDAFHVGQEAHIEHAVGFIEHQDFHTLEPGIALVEMVQQAAGAGDQDLDTVAQGAHLGRGTHAAIDGGAADVRTRSQVADGFVDLFGEFAGGGDDQCTGAVARTGQ